MNSAPKILLPLLLLAAAAAGIYAYIGGGDTSGPPPAPMPRHDPQPEPPTPAPVQQAVSTTNDPSPQPPPANVRVEVPTTSDEDARQGVRGRVLLPTGAPAIDVPVFLMSSTTSDPLQFYLANKTGQKLLPVAQGRTAGDGTFALGVQKAGETYDLRVAPDSYPELHHRSIKVRADDWYDCNDLQLSVGVIVHGRVVEEGSGLPIADAQVFLANPNQAYQMLATPGRERGIPTITDRGGFFRFDNAPREGLITLSAEGPEHAYAEKPNLQIKTDVPNEFTIELVRGQPLGGIVVDGNGKPIAGANVGISALSAKTPMNTSLPTGSDGVFLLPMLRPGPYKVQATANGYEDSTPLHEFTGNTEIKLVLEQRGRVRLRVLSARGLPLKVYHVSLKRYFPNNPTSIGKVPEFRDRRITPGDYEGDYANIPNVPNGEFVFQILENDHAKTLSAPFQMAAGQDPPQVEVALTMGASLTGVVVDGQGRPVAGATVATDMNGGLAADTGFFEIFRQFLPDKHTATSDKTDGQGRFRISKLAFADYMLRVSHPDFCEGASFDIKLETSGQTLDVGTITLQRGALVEGVCTVAGQPAGQVKVTVGPPDNAQPQINPPGAQKAFFTASAITDNDGRYRLLKRVPPGEYKIHAAKEAGNDNIFGKLLQMKQTQRPLTIGIGQERTTQNFDLPAQ